MSEKGQMKMANNRKRLVTTAKFNLIADHVKAIQGILDGESEDFHVSFVITLSAGHDTSRFDILTYEEEDEYKPSFAEKVKKMMDRQAEKDGIKEIFLEDEPS